MQITISVNQRGVITLPAKLRKVLGVKGDDLLIAETTPDGVLLRPAVALPIEIYSEQQRAEFEAAEEDLADWYGKRGH
jgi:AbrB family looped-hinge helix DNA binding protein